MADTMNPFSTTSFIINGKKYMFKTCKSMEPFNREVLARHEYSILRLPDYKPRVIFDIGANIGAYSLYVSILYPNVHIYSYEPVKSNFSLLKENLGAMENVSLHNYGLSDKDEIRKIYYGKNNPGESSVRRGWQQIDEGEEIILKRLSQEIDEKGIEKVDIIKIDTEGCELPILRDIRFFIDRVDFILLEYHLERERREIDALLSEGFILFGGVIKMIHRGILKYINKRVIRSLSAFREIDEMESRK